jgi:predicted PhzF superfamily epimerase YddE/YHI9
VHPRVLHVLRVFCEADGSGGNPLGVFLDGDAVPERERQAIAHDLGFAETVFVDDPGRGELRIFTPSVELPLAGHPLVGSAWLLRETQRPTEKLRPPAGEVAVRFDGELTFIAGEPDWGPPFELDQLEEAQAVDESAPATARNRMIWAWMDEAAGLIRARVFVPEGGIVEDEATGSAALRLAAALGRPIEIRQGRGSTLYARPLRDGMAEVGGLVALDEVRDYPVAAAS